MDTPTQHIALYLPVPTRDHSAFLWQLQAKMVCGLIVTATDAATSTVSYSIRVVYLGSFRLPWLRAASKSVHYAFESHRGHPP